MFWIHHFKWDVLFLGLFYFTVNEISLGFGLLVGQNETFEDMPETVVVIF